MQRVRLFSLTQALYLIVHPFIILIATNATAVILFLFFRVSRNCVNCDSDCSTESPPCNHLRIHIGTYEGEYFIEVFLGTPALS